jgi:hypothetical protein
MNFDKNIDTVLSVNKKAHDVIKSCKTMTQYEGAERYVDLVEKYYGHIQCDNKLQLEYLDNSLENIRVVLKLQKKRSLQFD